MDFHQLDFYEFEEKEFIENNFFVENYEHFPCSLILRLKVETRKELFALSYKKLQDANFSTQLINFKNAVLLIEYKSESLYGESHVPMSFSNYYKLLYGK